MTEEKIELLIGRLKALTNDFGYMLDKKDQTKEWNAYRNGYNDGVSKCSERIDKLLTELFGKWEENFVCNDCKGKGYLTSMEHITKYE